MVFGTFLSRSVGWTPTWSETVIYWAGGPFRAAGTWRNSGPRPKTENRNFLELGALLGKESVRPKSFSPKLRNFFTFCFLADGTPTGGKSQITGFVGPFGLGKPLGT